MDKLHYEEMVKQVNGLIQETFIQEKKIFLFGHCHATEKLADLLLNKGFSIAAILDNNTAKHGKNYHGIIIYPPQIILSESQEQTLVCIAARAYAAMADQLQRLGYRGQIRKLVDYNSYSEYSLSSDTLARKKQRLERGLDLLKKFQQRYPDHFKILCPFSALGDIYFTMSYLPYFIQKRKIKQWVIGVIGKACAEVVKIFGKYTVEVFSQRDMDETIQAALYTQDKNTFIPHQDRPYVVNLSKVLYIKCIPLEQIYCCGVFGLPVSAKPYVPVCLKSYPHLEQIIPQKTVILSPYAKSVTALEIDVWKAIINHYKSKGYLCYTNTAGEEEPLPDTQPISPSISEMQSVVEYAGTFIGIRSGLCDVIREASCRKIALYPDYYYCDTKWKAIDMYALKGWENIVVGEEWNGKSTEFVNASKNMDI